MTSVAGRLDRLEGQREAGEARWLVGGLAARHGVDAGAIRAETARVIGRASVGGWSVDDELAAIAAATGRPVAAVRAEHAAILAGMGR